MPPQLRLDAVRLADDRVTVEYTHTLDTLPVTPSGTGATWLTRADLEDQLQTLTQVLTQPETLLLLALLAAQGAEGLGSIVVRVGQVLVFDPTRLMA
jgi:hypothetical protein